MVFPIVSALGPALISGAFSALGQRSANRTNIALMRERHAFQERMSSTAYQRGMADMKKAGLNPILAYRQGPATTPGGASAQVGNVGAAFADAFGKTGSSAIAARRQEEELKNIAADTNKKYDESEVLRTENTRRLQDIANMQKTEQLLELQMHTAKREATRADVDRKLVEENPTLRKIGSFLRELGVTGNSAISTMRR